MAPAAPVIDLALGQCQSSESGPDPGRMCPRIGSYLGCCVPAGPASFHLLTTLPRTQYCSNIYQSGLHGLMRGKISQSHVSTSDRMKQLTQLFSLPAQSKLCTSNPLRLIHSLCTGPVRLRTVSAYVYVTAMQCCVNCVRCGLYKGGGIGVHDHTKNRKYLCIQV